VPVSTVHLHPVFEVLGLLVAAYVVYRLLRRAPHDGVVRCLGLALLVLALLSPIVWAWYVTWGVVVAAAAATTRMRSALIVISTFWAFAGVTSVHDIQVRLVHTSVLTDLLLATLLLAVAIMPLEQFAQLGTHRPQLPRVSTRLAGAGAATG
jgi:hypothetical protein